MSKQEVLDCFIQSNGLSSMKYSLSIRRGQRSLRMHFNDKGDLLVSIPYFASVGALKDFLDKNLTWIKDNKEKFCNHSFAIGDKFPLWGEEKTLVLQHTDVRKPIVCVLNNLLMVYTNSNDSLLIKKAIYRYYCEVLMDYVEERTSYWCNKIGLEVPLIKLCNSKTRWGVCYKQKKTIRYSLICASINQDLVDMIVLHEVCHLVYGGHQSDFWNLVEQNMDDIKQRKARLRKVSKTGIYKNLF